MSHRRSATQRYFEFALWAGRRRLPPTPREVAEFFDVHVQSARAIRKAWLDARTTSAMRLAQACAERIEADTSRRDAVLGAALEKIFTPSASAEPLHKE